MTVLACLAFVLPQANADPPTVADMPGLTIQHDAANFDFDTAYTMQTAFVSVDSPVLFLPQLPDGYSLLLADGYKPAIVRPPDINSTNLFATSSNRQIFKLLKTADKNLVLHKDPGWI